MVISAIRNVSFGRKFSAQEQKEWEKTRSEASKVLGLGKTSATVFDFSVPTKEKNTGIGTTFSPEAQELAGMLKAMCGVNSIQLGPQGRVSNMVKSPYSGSSFSYGKHLIDLRKLASDDYGKLLTSKDLEAPYFSRTKKADSVDYDNVFSPDGQNAVLKTAYGRFRELDETSPLKQEFEQFKKDNSYWVERDALFEAEAVKNGTDDVRKWSKEDQDVFATRNGNQAIIAELKKVTDADGNNVVEYEEFVQFIADKQQREAKANFNAQGIDLDGDCANGFDAKDFWSHKSAFSKEYEFGCDIGDGKFSCWSPAFDFSKLNGEAGELLYNKFSTFFKRYDGVRIDAAWQLMNPTVCVPIKNNGQDVFDEKGNKLGTPYHSQPQIANGGAYIIDNILLKAADDNNVPHDKIALELLGGNSWQSLDAVKGKGMTLIHIQQYGGDNWGRVKYYESQGDNKYQNMRPGQYIIGPGTHDNISMIEQAKNGENRAGYIAHDLRLDYGKLTQPNQKEAAKERSSAFFAELFTTKNQFATLPDIVGSERVINVPNTQSGNWEYRLSTNYEDEYHKNLQQGKGLNLPDALAKAVKAKQFGSPSALTQKLERFAQILREPEPKSFKANA